MSTEQQTFETGARKRIETIYWFALLIRERIPVVLGFMTVPHLVWGLGLGIVAGYGLRPAPATQDK
jgi:hypothetical protein